LRILHVVPTYWPAARYGGPIRSVHALARGLAARGHDVHVFTTNVDGAAESAVPLGAPVDMEGVQVTYFPSRSLRRLYWSGAMAQALAAQIASFDIAHLHSVFLWPTWAAARAARAACVPYVLSPRGMLVPELVRSKNRWLKMAWIALIERRNVVAAAAIHTTSDLEARDLARFGWVLPRVAVIPNGVDVPVDAAGRPVSLDVATAIAGGDMVLSLGRIVWKKGLLRLIAALPTVPAARLVLAGDDPEAHVALLLREATRLGVADRVTVLARHVEGADKEALFTAARAFAMPSLSENFGIAAVEAMRRGLPVLVTPEVGAADLIRESGGGMVVEGQPGAIAAGLNRLLASQGASRAMGAAGRAYVSARYDWSSIAASMENLYASILLHTARSAPRRPNG
jgi:glycosyltransferase involved in cell wall biosynthesis